jgi:hypothetical protein
MTPKDWKDINDYARQLDWETGRCIYPENRARLHWWQRTLLPVKSFLRYLMGIPIPGYRHTSEHLERNFLCFGVDGIRSYRIQVLVSVPMSSGSDTRTRHSPLVVSPLR